MQLASPELGWPPSLPRRRSRRWCWPRSWNWRCWCSWTIHHHTPKIPLTKSVRHSPSTVSSRLVCLSLTLRPALPRDSRNSRTDLLNASRDHIDPRNDEHSSNRSDAPIYERRRLAATSYGPYSGVLPSRSNDHGAIARNVRRRLLCFNAGPMHYTARWQDSPPDSPPSSPNVTVAPSASRCAPASASCTNTLYRVELSSEKRRICSSRDRFADFCEVFAVRSTSTKLSLCHRRARSYRTRHPLSTLRDDSTKTDFFRGGAEGEEFLISMNLCVSVRGIRPTRPARSVAGGGRRLRRDRGLWRVLRRSRRRR